MSTLSGLADLVVAGLNGFLDRAEDPEVLLARAIREMEDGLNDARRDGAAVIAGERQMGRELEVIRRQAESWKQRARHALTAHREDLARRALARRLECLESARGLDAALADARQAATTVRVALRALEDRLDEARRDLVLLRAQRRVARAGAVVSGPTGVLESEVMNGEWAVEAELVILRAEVQCQTIEPGR
jgi:phage shock protein A